ncbi:hypothetical protein ABZZ79_13660 [Streptomyces sp. NPDC006458]|uniref:hypothetical protein n=1 Tax=Streptomyces sp. NPDC006458 TaxID=3154302 RepID=UPI0033AB143C
MVDEGPGVHRDDLPREAARFGWALLGADIRDALTDIDALIAEGDLTESGLV